MTVDQLLRFPRWLFRRLFELRDDELDAALAVSCKLNDLRRGEWRRLLSRCERWYAKGEPAAFGACKRS